jgi:hypothetical protein
MKKIVAISLAVMALGLAASAGADVILTRKMEFEIMGIPPNEVVSTEQFQGDKCRSVTEFVGGAMLAMTGEQPAPEINITRLDKGVVWNFNESSKTYREVNLSDFKDIAEQAAGLESTPDAPDKYEWTTEVKHEEKTTEYGFDCKVIIATATGIGKENPDDKAELHYEYWVGIDFAGKEELDAYTRQYTEVTGLDLVGKNQQFKKMVGEFGAQFEKMVANFEDIKGYPIKTVITSRKSGDVSIPGMPEGEDLDPEAAAMMKKMMGKKEEASEDGMQTIFSVTAEVVKISSEAVDAGVFDIPEGYTAR